MTPRARPTPDAGPELDLAAALDARVADAYTGVLTEDERAEADPVTLYVVIAPQVFVRMRPVTGPSGKAYRNRPFTAGAILPADVDAEQLPHMVTTGLVRPVTVDPRTGEVTTR